MTGDYNNITTNGNAPAAAVPSITLQITQKDAERVLGASRSLAATLADIDSNNNSGDAQDQQEAIYEQLHKAAKQCKDPSILHFLERIASLNDKEVMGAVLLFHESDKTWKLRQLFSLLATNNHNNNNNQEDDPRLNRSDAASLFLTVLTAISSCLPLDHQQHSPTNSNGNKGGSGSVIVVGKPTPSSSPERPTKKAKLYHGGGAGDAATASTKDETDIESSPLPSQSPSFDSSLATLRDEDDRKEIDDVASYAADELVKYAMGKQQHHSSDGDNINGITKENEDVMVDFTTFGNWYNERGSVIIPWIELLQLAKWTAPEKSAPAAAASRSRSPAKPKDDRQYDASSPASLLPEEDQSRTLVSFDFNGSGSPTPLLINITEDNLFALRDLVQRTNLIQRAAPEVCRVLLHAGCHRAVSGKDLIVLRKDEFRRLIRKLIPEYVYAQLTRDEKDIFEASLLDFFACFEQAKPILHEGEVDVKEFAVGFCFFCAGNKSSKLAAGYELLDSKRRGYLTEDQLLRYLQAYLTTLVGMSLLSPVNKRRQRRRGLSLDRRKSMRTAIESGAKWTLGHFLKASNQTRNEYTFESFATWYSSGGYNIAPWLELLDLSKVLSLIAEPSANDSPSPLPPLQTGRPYTAEQRPRARDRVSSLRRHHSSRRGPAPPEVLFTFPLGNRRSLVVLREDASYVRAVVDQLGLLMMQPDELWTALSGAVEKRRKPMAHPEFAIYVNMRTFVESMMEVCPRLSRKRSAPGSSIHATSSSNEELLANFFQCFDVNQTDSVALDELMGGLTVLCGGKKSHKLAFAFSIFDTRPGVQGPAGKKRGIVHSLCGEDLFLFLRSILIVTFSTCRQSLDLTDDMVGRCIADTANMICNDVMRHQWETKRLDRLDFDEFGQWYNDGGFERAPWLELLDLKKWVLVDELEAAEKYMASGPPPLPPPLPAYAPPPIATVPSRDNMPGDSSIPPPPPEDALDNSFFDTDAIMPLDSMDEMDMILMQSSHDKEDGPLKLTKSFTHSPRRSQHPPPSESQGHPLKFHLNTTDKDGGYMLSLSQARIRHFRQLLESSGLHQVKTEIACNQILGQASQGRISREGYDSAISGILPASGRENSLLLGVLSGVFAGFDRNGTGQASALEVACGFTVLCRGKKSDKLEFAFEVLDKKKHGRLSREDMASYLQSFLTVLLSIAFSPSLANDPVDDTLATMNGVRSDRNTATLIHAAKAGAEWAASLAFSVFDQSKKHSPSMSFDDFADWYTTVGYSSIPWLELLDLQKWAMTSESTK